MFTHLTDTAKAWTFYGIAFGLTVIVSLLAPLLGMATMFLHMFSPTVATLLMLLVVTRDGYSRSSWQALGLHRVGLRGWPLALVGSLVMMSAVYGLAWSTGIGQVVLPEGWTLTTIVLDLMIALVITSVFALGEEIGFRGYLLPRLMPMGAPRALLLSGLLHGIWHFPLILLTSALPINGTWLIAGPIFLLVLTAAGTFYGFLFLDTGSVWAPTVAHGAINALINLYKAITVSATPVALQYLVGETGVFTLVITALFAVWAFYRLRQPQRTAATQIPAGL